MLGVLLCVPYGGAGVKENDPCRVNQMLDYISLLVALIDRHWEVLYGLLVAVGLVIYVAASHSLHQRRHPSAAIAWVLGILLVPYIALPLYLAFGSRKVVASFSPGHGRRIHMTGFSMPCLPLLDAAIAWSISPLRRDRGKP